MLRFLVVLLFALILAAIYEIFYVRGGHTISLIPWSSFSTLYTKGKTYLREKILSVKWSSHQKSRWSKKMDASGRNLDDAVLWEKKEETVDLKKDLISWKISLSSIKASILFPEEYWKIFVAQFCHYGSELCLDSFRSWIEESIGNILRDEALSFSTRRFSFVWSLSPLENMIWRWDACLRDLFPEKVLVYHDMLQHTWKTLRISDVSTILSELWGEWLQSCVSEWSYWFRLKSIMSQAKNLFDVKKVPSIIVVNTETWAWIMIPGVYPSREVLREVRLFLKKDRD